MTLKLDFLTGTEQLTSQDLIADSARVVDFSFAERDKACILKRIQYWKNFFRKHGYRRVMLMQHTSMDTIGVIYACAELGLTICTSHIQEEAFVSVARTADVVLLGITFAPAIKPEKYPDINFLIINEKQFNQEFNSQEIVYTPEVIDLNHRLIESSTSGASPTPIIMAHTARTFINGGINSRYLYVPEDVYVSNHGINHIGLIAMCMVAPLMVGLKLFTINHVYEMMVMMTRNIFTKINLYEHFLDMFRKNPDFNAPANCLQDTTVLTCGGPLSEPFIDTMFGWGAKKIISWYGCNETLSGFFTVEVDDKYADLTKLGIGKLNPDAEYKIVDDYCWVKTPSLSDYCVKDSDGFYNTGDYIKEENGTVTYLGRVKHTLPTGEKIYTLEIQRWICWTTPGLAFSEYVVDVEYADDTARVKLYPMTENAADLITSNVDTIKETLSNRIKLSKVELDIYTDVVGQFDPTGFRHNLYTIGKLIVKNPLRNIYIIKEEK